jgi:hypothetical protein
MCSLTTFGRFVTANEIATAPIWISKSSLNGPVNRFQLLTFCEKARSFLSRDHDAEPSQTP